MKKTAVIVLLCSIVALTGCASQQKYYWGNYESSLYQHYRNPGDVEDYSENLAGIIENGEQKGKKIPPGIYAEYGYILLVQGKNKEALAFFEREKQEWPESTYLMDSMIKNASAEKEKMQEADSRIINEGGGQE